MIEPTIGLAHYPGRVLLGHSPILILAGVVALGVVVYSVWRLDPAYTLSAAIVLSPVAGNWPQIGIPGPMSPDRLLLAAGIAQVLLRSPTMRRRPRLRLGPEHVLLALAALYALSSAFFSGTMFQKAPLLKIVDAYGILPFLAFIAAPLAFRTERQRRVLLVSLVGLGTYLGLTTLFEIIHLNALVWPRYILNASYGIHQGKGRGVFVDAVANGFGLYACSVASGIAISRWSRPSSRLFAAAVAALCIVGALVSEERSVWIGATVATLITMIVVPTLRRYLVPTVLVVVLAIGAALVAIPGLATTVDNRLNNQSTIWDRENLAVAAYNMIRARPLIGFGWSRFQDFSRYYFRQSQSYPLTATTAGEHNYFLLYAVELGLPGLTLWALGLLSGIGSALSTRGPPDLHPWRAGLIAVFVIFVIVANFVPPTLFQNLLLWLWAGVVFSGRYGPPAAGDMPAARHRLPMQPARPLTELPSRLAAGSSARGTGPATAWPAPADPS